MLPFTIEKLADVPIVLFTVKPDYKISAHGLDGVVAAMSTLDAQSAPVYLICDALGMVINFNDVLQSITLATRQYHLFTHRNVIEVVIVTEKTFLKAAMEGLSNPMFGNIWVPVFDTLEAALAYALEPQRN